MGVLLLVLLLALVLEAWGWQCTRCDSRGNGARGLAHWFRRAQRLWPLVPLVTTWMGQV